MNNIETKVSKIFARIGVTLIFLMGSQQLWASPEGFALQGQIKKPDGSNLEAASVDFTVQIFSPLPDSCLLYEETFATVNMTGSKGIFNLNVGTGSQSGGDFEDSSTLTAIMNNAAGPITPTTCTSGGPNYSASPTDKRLLRLSFNDGSGAVTLAQDHEISSVPFAQYAKTVEGLGASDLLKVNIGTAVLTQANLESIFTVAGDVTDLRALIDGSSSDYLSSAPAAAVGFNNQRVTDVASPTLGTDAANRNYVDANLGGNTISTGVLGVGETGQVLTWNGTQWVSQTLSAAGDVNNDGNTFAGLMTLGTNDNFGLNLETNNTTAIAIDNTQGVSLSAGLGVTGGVNAGGNVALLAESELQLQDAAGGEYIGFKAPTTLTASQTFTLPDGDGGANQVLATDGSGTLIWQTDANTGGDFESDGSVAMTGPLNLGGQYLSGDGDAEGLFVDTLGRVGIGTTMAFTNLDVKATIGQSTIRAFSTDANGGGIFRGRSDSAQLFLGAYGSTVASTMADGTPIADAVVLSTDGGGASVAPSRMIISNTAAIPMHFGTNDLVRATIDSSGLMGIGTSAPGTKLDVEGRITAGPIDGTAGNTGSIVFEDSDASNYSGIRAADATTADYLLTLPATAGAANQVLTNTATPGVLAWSTPTTGSGDFESDGSVAMSGNLNIGTNFVNGDGDSEGLSINTSGRVTAGVGATVNALRARGGGGMGSWGGITTSSSTFHIDNNTINLYFDGDTIVSDGGFPLQIGTMNSQPIRFGTNNSEKAVLASGGDFGIGTTTPGSKLDVEGRITAGPIDGAAGNTGSIVFEDSDASNYSGIRAADATTADYLLTLPATAGAANQVLTNTATPGVLAWSTPTTGSGDFESDGSVAMTGNLNLNNNSLIGGIASGDDVTIESTTDATKGDVILQPNGGGVGVGTTSPGVFRFQVNHDYFRVAQFGNTDSTDSAIQVGIPGTTSRSWLALEAAGGNDFLLSANGSNNRFSIIAGDNIGISPERLVVESSGNVGIGTTAPGTILDVEGRITAGPIDGTAGNTGSIIFEDSDASNSSGIRAADATTADYLLTLPATAGAANQVLTNTATPGVLAWSTPTTGSGDFESDGSVAMTGNLNLNNNSLIGGIASGDDVTIESTTDATKGDVVLQPNGGRVGIGTATPSIAGTGTVLHIHESVGPNSAGVHMTNSTTGAAALDGFLVSYWQNQHALVWNNENTPMVFATNGTEAFRIAADGNLGIGTDAPGTKLDVEGRITAGPIDGTAGNTGSIIFEDSDASNSSGIRAADATTADYLLTLPADAGAVNQVLSNTATPGVLAWTTPSTGATTLGALTDVVTNYANDNMFLGTGTGGSISSGTGNTILGDSAAPSLSTGSNNIVVGAGALPSENDVNNTIAIGTNALFGSAGDGNVAIGNEALFNNFGTTGANNTAVGTSAGKTIVDIFTSSTFLGGSAGFNGGGNNVVGIGEGSLYEGRGDFNVAVGSGTGRQLSGASNVFVGYHSYFNNIGTSTGAHNVALGNQTAGNSDTKTGDNNVSIGSGAHFALRAGANNIAIGKSAGDNITSGSTNITIGHDLDALSATGDNQLNIAGVILGDLATGDITIDNELRLSDSDDSNYVSFVAPAVVATDLTWVLPSVLGTANQVLRNSSTPGTLEWATAATGTGDFESDGSVAMTGTFKAADGTAALPGVTFNSDPNTGLFSDTADELGFSTAGTERVTIDASGNVGIGTTAPSSALHIVNTIPETTSGVHKEFTVAPTGAGTTIGEEIDLTSTNVVGHLLYGLHVDVSNGANVRQRIGIYGQAGGHMNEGGATDPTLFSAGVKGVGQRSAPGVFGYNASSTGTGYSGTAGIYGVSATNNGDGVIGKNSSGTNGSESAGVKGWATGPNSAFFAKHEGNPFSTDGVIGGHADAIAGGHYVYLKQDSSAFTGNGIVLDFADGASGTFTGNFIELQNADVVQFVVKSDGSVGVGTTTPGAKLSVNGAIINSSAVQDDAGAVDFALGNIQFTTNSCGAIDLHNLKSGGSYSFGVQGATAATCVFSAYSDAGTTALTVHMPSDHGATTVSTHTMYTFIVMGTHLYASWIPAL